MRTYPEIGGKATRQSRDALRVFEPLFKDTGFFVLSLIRKIDPLLVIYLSNRPKVLHNLLPIRWGLPELLQKNRPRDRALDIE